MLRRPKISSKGCDLEAGQTGQTSEDKVILIIFLRGIYVIWKCGMIDELYMYVLILICIMYVYI